MKKKQIYIKNLFSCTGIYNDKKENLDKLTINNKTSNEIENIKNIVKKFSHDHKKVNIFLDLCEVDDKNYHSGVRFTFFAKNVRGEIARGGRYIVNRVNRNDVGTGFTCYMDTILRASSIKIEEKKVLIPFDSLKILIKDLIKKKYSVVKHQENSKISKKIAKAQRCQYYLDKNIVKKV